MSGSHSISSQGPLLPDEHNNSMNSNAHHYAPNQFMRDPSSISANDVGINKVLDKDADVGEQLVYQVDIENDLLLRQDKRSELAGKNACLTQRWQTALVICLVLLALGGAIGGLAYWITLPKVITQPFLLYGETCYMNSRSCDETRMLWCPAGKCICMGNFQWNATAQNCSCGLYQSWTGFKCQNYGSYGDPCNSIPCLPTLTCSPVVNQTYTTNQAICNCDNATYLNTISGSSTLGKCVPRLSYNQNCLTSTDCQNWLGLACTATGSGTKCQCDSTSYWNGLTCIRNPRGWEPCSIAIPCDTTRGLSCVSNICQCNADSFWDNVTTLNCQQKRTYSVICQYDFQCNTTVNLTCPLVSTGCSCPTTSNGGICDCQFGTFWDGQRCTPVHIFNGTCPEQYACRANLVCYLGHCICPGNMGWNSTMCGCLNGTTWNTTINSCI